MTFSSDMIFTALLDTMNFGVFVLDDQRKPLFANAQALKLTGEGQPLYIDGLGVLRATHAPADKRICDGIEALRGCPHKGKVRPIRVDRDQHQPEVFAWLSLLAVASDTSPSDPSAGFDEVISLMVTEKTQKEIGGDVLAGLFNLTPAESRLLTCLLQGLSTLQYAAQSKLSQNTVRNQLKSIFEKTDVRRQSDLVGLVSTVLAPVNFDPVPDRNPGCAEAKLQM
jgi:DNA-binding CsgD family transcriptional regulator